MSTIEKRVHALEQDNAAHKLTEELLTTAIHGLVSREAFKNLQETVELTQQQNNKIFDALNAHDRLTNVRLGDLQTQLIEQDGKIVGLQTEMRQQFAEQNKTIATLDGKVVGLQTEMRQRFSEQDGKLAEQTVLIQQILARLPDRA